MQLSSWQLQGAPPFSHCLLPPPPPPCPTTCARTHALTPLHTTLPTGISGSFLSGVVMDLLTNKLKDNEVRVAMGEKGGRREGGRGA